MQCFSVVMTVKVTAYILFLYMYIVHI